MSSYDQKNGLTVQAGRRAVWAAVNGYTVNKVITETGSGLNPHHKQLMALLVDAFVTTIILEHRDRLMRLGSEHIEAALAAQKTGHCGPGS